MKNSANILFLTSCGILALACGVDSTGNDTGGVEDSLGGSGPGGSSCPRGATIVLTDYVSTQIALSDLTGETKSASFLSTASTDTDGLAFALSGDVSVPSAPTLSGNVVLFDRFGTNVITWADPKTAKVIAQLPVGTGFESNPQDYLEVSEDLALITRWGQNPASGKEDFDEGGDLLLIDLKKHAIVDNLLMPMVDDLPARPGPLALVGDEVIVTLDRMALDFSETGETILVGVHPNGTEILWQRTLKGRKACGRATLSPDGKRLALVCTGALTASSGETESLSQSGVILFDAESRPLEQIAVYEAEDLFGIPLQDDIAFVNDNLVLLKTQTPWGGDGNNQLFSLDLETKQTELLLEASPDSEGKGKGLVYGALACAPGCSDYCLMADSDEAVVQRIFVENDGSLKILSPEIVEDSVGLPPVTLGLR